MWPLCKWLHEMYCCETIQPSVVHSNPTSYYWALFFNNIRDSAGQENGLPEFKRLPQDDIHCSWLPTDLGLSLFLSHQKWVDLWSHWLLYVFQQVILQTHSRTGVQLFNFLSLISSSQRGISSWFYKKGVSNNQLLIVAIAFSAYGIGPVGTNVVHMLMKLLNISLIAIVFICIILFIKKKKKKKKPPVVMSHIYFLLFLLYIRWYRL